MSTVWKVLALATAAAVVLLAVGVFVVATRPAPVTDKPAQATTSTAESGLTISAQGQVKAKPDVAYISLGVRTNAPTAQEAMRQNSAALAAVIAKLDSMGIAKKDMQTSYINLSTETTQVKPGDQTSEKITSYWASNSLSLTLNDLSKVGEVLDAAIGAGANSIDGIRFSVKDDSALRDQALTDAIKTARSKADLVAGQLGVKVTTVQSVTVESYSGPGPVYSMAAASAMRDSAGVPIEAGEVTFSASVRVTFNF